VRHVRLLDCRSGKAASGKYVEDSGNGSDHRHQAKVTGIDDPRKSDQRAEPQQKTKRLSDQLCRPSANCLLLERVHRLVIR
jgi:hypothetical protein